MAKTPGSGGQAKCGACGFIYSHRECRQLTSPEPKIIQGSSLSRHIRETCGRQRTPGYRQKSCVHCARSKARCSLRRPKCERCTAKGIACKYLSREEDDQGSGRQERHRGHMSAAVDTQATSKSLVNAEFPSDAEQPMPWSSETSELGSSRQAETSPGGLTRRFNVADTSIGRPNDSDILAGQIDLTTAGVTHSFNAVPSLDEFSAQLLPLDSSLAFWPPGAFALQGSSSKPVYNSMELILRCLRSWPGMLAEGFQVPSLFHHSQMPPVWEDADPSAMTPELANCITITKMWHGQQAGAEKLVQDTVLREVDVLLEAFPDSDEKSQLCTLQVLLIYAILILSPSKGWRNAQSVDAALFARIKRAVQSVIGEQLYPQTEREEPSRLNWTTWVNIVAKRRAVLALYLLHWAYSIYHGVQSFDCLELAFMPAPCAKVLWQARTEREWDTLYSRWLERWKGGMYLQGEFAAVNGGVVLGERAERWLQEADDFGLIMMAIVNATEFE